MFKPVYNFLNSFRLRENRGQVAVILIFVVAVSLIFYAVSLNLGRASQTKTITTIASNVGASQLASSMASYGQALVQTTLGGQTQVCSFSPIIAAVLALILLVIGFLCFGCTWGPGVAALKAAAAAAIAIASITIKLVIIEPGLTEMWNKLTVDNLSTRNQFLEAGISTALQNVVTDDKRVPDLNDIDLDRLYGLNGAIPVDEISRYGFYYTERLKTIEPINTEKIEQFQADLAALLYVSGAGDFGFYDPIPGCPSSHPCCYIPLGPTVPSECNPCCQPKQYVELALGLSPIQNPEYPDCCDCFLLGTCSNPSEQCGVSSTCQVGSPYGSGPLQYSFIYDKYFENSLNNGVGVLSFREKIGRDDEHRLYVKDPDGPNEASLSMINPFATDNLNLDFFQLEDATGFYVDPYSPTFPEDRPGIFPFFWKLLQWEVDLENVQGFSPFDRDCHWCDPRDPSGNCATCDASQPLEIPQLELPRDPSDPSAIIAYDDSYFVQGENAYTPGVNIPPRGIDKIGLSSNNKILADDGECAQDSLHPTPTIGGFWKRGGDRYCSEGDTANPFTWPYQGHCTKHGPYGTCSEPIDPSDPTAGSSPRDCLCSEAPAVAAIIWPDDPLDDLVYGSEFFIEVAQKFINENPADIIENFDQWYADISVWIEEGGKNPPFCFTCAQEDGGLWIWKKEMEEIIKRLNDWVYTNYVGYGSPGEECNVTWCPPQPGACPYNNPDEDATFDFNGNGTLGDMEDIIACLDWNVNDSHQYVEDVVTAPGVMAAIPVEDIGNAQKLRACASKCTIETCYDELPRTLIDYEQYNPGDFKTFVDNYSSTIRPLDEPHLRLFLNCVDNCSNTACRNMPTHRISDGSSYFPASLESILPTYDFEATGTDCITDSVTGQVFLNPGPGPTPSIWWGPVVAAIWTINPMCSPDSNNPGPGDIHPLDDAFATIFPAINPGDPKNNWRNSTVQAAVEAENQVAKMAKRLEFLQNRHEEVRYIVDDVMQPAVDALDQFLTCQFDAFGEVIGGPACQLIDLALNFDEADPGLPYQAIYGWQSDPPPGRPDGYWHIVRVDARLSGRCDNACDAFQTGPIAFPIVKTESKSWGLERCYKVENANGTVKMRVTRWDENRDSNPILFPNGQPIWDFRFYHPEREKTLDGQDIESNCSVAYLPDPSGVNPGIYDGAYMLNERCNGDLGCGGINNMDCWLLSQKLLATGVMTETCGQYYDAGNGLGIRFTDCLNF